ncbi:MAG: carboxypeptidase-like regulatory domain-containing protein [Candidatus Aminicenantes bacterium]|nr:carboxypeptidase-like regulatory domain-containing protein [Candidatus Aminicenantes bacterium]
MIGLLLGMPSVSDAGEGRGILTGNVFEADGVTPVKGAIVVIRNVSTVREFLSKETDDNGSFEISGIEKGIYLHGVSTSAGNYNSNSDVLIGIKESEKNNVIIVLNQFEDREAAVTGEIYKNLKLDGEALIGRIVGFNPVTMTAEVFLIYGFLKQSAKIHILGEQTDFQQEIASLFVNGEEVEKAFAGETMSIKLNNTAAVNDDVYISCKKFGVLPVFLKNPFGLAVLIAGSGLLTYGILEPTGKSFLSPYMPKKK